MSIVPKKKDEIEVFGKEKRVGLVIKMGDMEFPLPPLRENTWYSIIGSYSSCQRKFLGLVREI